MTRWQDLLPPDVFIAEALPPPDSIVNKLLQQLMHTESLQQGQEFWSDITAALINGLQVRLAGDYGKRLNDQRDCLAQHVATLQQHYAFDNPESLVNFLVETSDLIVNRIDDNSGYNLAALARIYGHPQQSG